MPHTPEVAVLVRAESNERHRISVFWNSPLNGKTLSCGSDDDMVSQFDTQYFSRGSQSLGHFNIRVRRIQPAGWMVVSDNDTTGIFHDGQFKNLPWMNKGRTG